MKYPQPTDYHTAIQNPRLAFLDSDLAESSVESDMMGMPLVNSGGFALTYFMKARLGKNWVVRCFKNESNDRRMRYQAINTFLRTNPLPIFTSATYIEQGIRVNGQMFPIVKMPKIVGTTLHRYIEQQISANQGIGDLHNQFQQLVGTLRSYHVAHGDLQHGNIMVSNGKLMLIDYDGIYVPDLRSLGSAESGHAAYQHPERRSEFGVDIDNFSSIVIYLALQALMNRPQLWKRYSNGDNLLFRATDFAEPEHSALLQEIASIGGLQPLVASFQKICQAPFAYVPTLPDFLGGKTPSVVASRQISTASTFAGQYRALDATLVDELLKDVGNRVTVVGKITVARSSTTRNGAPYIFLNLGDYQKGCLTLVLWSETLKLFQQQGQDPLKFQGKWVSVSGVVSTYQRSTRWATQPQIIIDLPTEIEVLGGGEDEAKQRLSGIHSGVSASISTPKIPPLGAAPRSGRELDTEQKISDLYARIPTKPVPPQIPVPPPTPTKPMTVAFPQVKSVPVSSVLQAQRPAANTFNSSTLPISAVKNKGENSWLGAMAKMLGVVLLILAFLFLVSWLGMAQNKPQPPNTGATSRAGEAASPIPVQAVSPIAEPTATPTPVPVIAQATNSTNGQDDGPTGFSPLFFCKADGFSLVSSKCARSRRVFSGTVEKIYVSWSPSDAYKGATFTRVWTIDGNFIVESTSTNEYAHLEVATRPSLKPGQYRVEIYVGETIVQSGSFTIE